MAQHRVTVYFDNRKVFQRLPGAWGPRYRLTEEVRDWLRESTEGKGWGDHQVQEVTTGDFVGVTFSFVEDYHAMLFKLTWGGK